MKILVASLILGLQGGAAVFVVALLKYSEDQVLGEQFLTIAIDGKWLVDRSGQRALESL